MKGIHHRIAHGHPDRGGCVLVFYRRSTCRTGATAQEAAEQAKRALATKIEAMAMALDTDGVREVSPCNPGARRSLYAVPRARRELTFFRNALEYRYVKYFTAARCGPTL